MLRDIFVPLIPQIESAAQLEAAAELALRLSAHVNVVFTRPDAVMAAASVPDMLAAAGVFCEDIEKEGASAEASSYLEFQRWCVAYGLVADQNGPHDAANATWRDRVGTVSKTIVDVGRVSDLVIVAKPGPFEVVTHEAFTTAVFETGKPTLVTPAKIAQSLFKHVLIAWDGSLQAARAVDGAMPILRKGDRVSIFSAPSNSEDLHQHGLIEHLSWHGIHAETLDMPHGLPHIGNALLDIAGEAHATMIVMGAYSHNRFREAVLGGVTRHVLEHCELPVLMMH